MLANDVSESRKKPDRNREGSDVVNNSTSQQHIGIVHSKPCNMHVSNTHTHAHTHVQSRAGMSGRQVTTVARLQDELYISMKIHTLFPAVCC